MRERWILGNAVALGEDLLIVESRAVLRILLLIAGCRHDDFGWRDPLPFFGQGLDYLPKCFLARGSVRPMTKGMVR